MLSFLLAVSMQALKERAEFESGLAPHRGPQWETRVLQQDFWPGQVVFHVDCRCGDVLPVTVAVERDGKEALALSDGNGSLQRTEEVRFNRVSRTERVHITQDGAGRYMSLFVTLHQRRGDVVLTGMEQVRQVLALKRSSPESESVARANAGKATVPEVVGIVGPKYAGTSYTWDPRKGEVTAWRMVVDTRGRMECATELVGTQSS